MLKLSGRKPHSALSSASPHYLNGTRARYGWVLRRLAVLVLTAPRLSPASSHLLIFVQAGLFRANNQTRLSVKTDVKSKLDSRLFLLIILGCSLYFLTLSAQSVNASDK